MWTDTPSASVTGTPSGSQSGSASPSASGSALAIVVVATAAAAAPKTSHLTFLALLVPFGLILAIVFVCWARFKCL